MSEPNRNNGEGHLSKETTINEIDDPGPRSPFATGGVIDSSSIRE